MDESKIQRTPIRGRWWRFSDYEYDGKWIRPAKGATLVEYDPWEHYDAAWSADEASDPRLKQLAQPPYQRLVEVWESKPINELSSRITAWCKEFGLLGCLPHRLQSAMLRPRWEKPSEELGVVPAVTTWVRGVQGWTAVKTYHTILRYTSLRGRPEDVGKLVPEEQLPAGFYPSSVLIRETAGSNRIEPKPLREVLWNFFPDLPREELDSHAYPPPLSEQFWRESGELEVDFITTAMEFSRVIKVLSAGPPGGDADGYQRLAFRRAQDSLEALASGIQLGVATTDVGTLDQRWASTSLISSLAAMVILDLTQKRLRQCAARGCGRPFASAAYQAMYCSVRCREREMKGRQRAKQKARNNKVEKRGKASGKKTGK